MGVPDTTSVFQGRSDKGVNAFLFNTFWTALEVALEEGYGGVCLVAHCVTVGPILKYKAYIGVLVVYAKYETNCMNRKMRC